MEKITELETLISSLTESVSALTNKHEAFEDMENEIESNLDAAIENKDLAFALCSLYLAQQKLNGTLKATDPVLKTIKKIQEREKRISSIQKNLEEEAKKPALAEQVFEKHIGQAKSNTELLRKRSAPRPGQETTE
jgi:hypothetical protein